MSQDQRAFYRFVPANKSEVITARGKVYLFSTERSEGRTSLRENEYELANLFNGRRSEEEIRDIVRKAKGLSLSADDLREFIVKLVGVGLLEEVQPPTPVGPRHRLALVAGKPKQVEADLADADLSKSSVEDEEETADAAFEMQANRRRKVESRSDGRSRGSWRRSRGRGLAPIEEGGNVEDVEFQEMEDIDRLPSADDILDEAFQGADASRGGRSAAAQKRGPRAHLLFRFPIRWLLPLGVPLGWAGRNRYSAILLGGLLCTVMLGLWLSRVELARDLERWLALTTVIQSMALAVVTLDLWPQLARAATYKKYLGEAPPFGVALIWNIVPTFAPDLSGLAKSRDVNAARAVFAASVSGAATICVLTCAGWLMTKNNGTALPLVWLGVAVLATIRLLLNLNPLWRRDGYYLMALSLRIPDLRQRAFNTLLRRQSPPLPPTARIRLPGWVLVTYALAVSAYIAVLFVLATVFVGGWLERKWSGSGVVLYLTLGALVLAGPIREARAGRVSRSRALQRYRPRTIGRRIWSMTKLALVLGALGATWLIPYNYEPGGNFELKPLQSNRTDVRSLISGRVEQLLVKEGDHVDSEQVLARISGDEERKNVESTEAAIRTLQAQLAEALAGATPEEIAVARQKVSTAKTRYQYSSSKAVRWGQLLESGFVSPQDYENVKGQAENDRELLLEAEKELAQLLAGTRQEEIDKLRAQIDEQKANLEYYRQQQLYTEIRSPISGYIVSGSLITAAGNYLKQGDLLATVQDSSNLIAEIQVPQFDITFARLGAPIRLKAWTLPDLEINGVVSTIAPSTDDTPSGKMVRVTGEVDNSNGTLKSGMTGYAKIESQEMPLPLAFTRWVVRFFQIELWSWLP